MNSNQALHCTEEKRRHKVRERKDKFNGLDYVEIIDGTHLRVYFLNEAPEEDLKRWHVVIRGGRRVRDINVAKVTMCRQDDPEQDDCMAVELDKTGDLSTYTLCLVQSNKERPEDEPFPGIEPRPTDEVYPGFDPRYACIEFSFQVLCPSDLDCAQDVPCPPSALIEPEISYLAKDYASFRQLILDRLALIMPDWQERHVPDVGIALVELLAYVGDYLSYYQDAVATEAYLDTARQRISVQRHARLVDYAMHEGNNARAWVHVEVVAGSGQPIDPETIFFITGHNDALPVDGRLLRWQEIASIPPDHYQVFEPLIVSKRFSGSASKRSGCVKAASASQTAAKNKPPEPLVFYTEHNKIHFYTWGDQECCIPQGATRATLLDEYDCHDGKDTGNGTTSVQHPPGQKQSKKNEHADLEPQRPLRHLKVGDVLVFEEVLGPVTGRPEDADQTHREVIRLTAVEFNEDPLYDKQVVEIEWDEADALTFPLCVSALTRDCEHKIVSVARGNMVLVDHGRSVDPESLGCVPSKLVSQGCIEAGWPVPPVKVPGRYRPRLQHGNITFFEPPESGVAASSALVQDPRRAVPSIRLTAMTDPGCEPDASTPLVPGNRPDVQDLSGGPDVEQNGPPLDPKGEKTTSPGQMWMARRDLIDSSAYDLRFVAEIDNDGRAHLRFGDGDLGAQPKPGTCFDACYRVGNGPVGNVGAEAISHVVTVGGVTLDGFDLRPRNPLPAQGGQAPESMADVKLFAPHAFHRRLERAITADDYATIVLRDFGDKVQRATAALRWTGSWNEVLVVIDPKGGHQTPGELLAAIRRHLLQYRRMGHDVMVEIARPVPLDIKFSVCVLPDYLRGHVKAALLARFSNRVLADGRLGFFHPDNLTIGEGVYLSHLVAAAQTVDGVESVTVDVLERRFEGPNREVESGLLTLGRLEVARLDNDPSMPENGCLTFVMGGGR